MEMFFAGIAGIGWLLLMTPKILVILLLRWAIKKTFQWRVVKRQEKAKKKDGDPFYDELLEKHEKLQDEISLLAAHPATLETLKDMVEQAETFNNFVREAVHDDRKYQCIVFYGRLEAQIAIIEHFARRKDKKR